MTSQWSRLPGSNMKDYMSVTIPSHPKYLSVIRCATSKFGELCGIPASELENIKLAVDEACSNVIKHAYRGDTNKKIVVKFNISKKRLNVIIEDSGIKANPECIAGRDLDDVRPGGLGIHLIKRAFDICAFDGKKKKGNRLILTRCVKGEK